MSCKTFHIASETSFVHFLENVTGVCHHHDADCWPHILMLFWSLEWLKGRHAFFHFYFRVTECIANSVYGPELWAKLALFFSFTWLPKTIKDPFLSSTNQCTYDLQYRFHIHRFLLERLDFTCMDSYWNDRILQAWIPIGMSEFHIHGFPFHIHFIGTAGHSMYGFPIGTTWFPMHWFL